MALGEGKTALFAFCWQWADSAVSIRVRNRAAVTTLLGRMLAPLRSTSSVKAFAFMKAANYN